MFMSVSSRAASAYKTIGAESAVHGASAHQLITMLFDGAQSAILQAKEAMRRRDIPTKGRQITQAVSIIQDGLIAHLDTLRGGEIADNLLRLYQYSVLRLTQANLRNDEAILDEVAGLLKTVADGWSEIRDAAGVASPKAS